MPGWVWGVKGLAWRTTPLRGIVPLTCTNGVCFVCFVATLPSLQCIGWVARVANDIDVFSQVRALCPVVVPRMHANGLTPLV